MYGIGDRAYYFRHFNINDWLLRQRKYKLNLSLLLAHLMPLLELQ